MRNTARCNGRWQCGSKQAGSFPAAAVFASCAERGKGHGKRGGLRAIYYRRDRKGEIWLLTIYAKNEAEDLPLPVIKALCKEIEP